MRNFSITLRTRLPKKRQHFELASRRDRDRAMRYAVLVTGPAGAGKSTFCSTLITHCHSIGRTVHLFNLDPAADKFEYEPSVDIRDLIGLQEVMEDLQFGPNGGLVCPSSFALFLLSVTRATVLRA